MQNGAIWGHYRTSNQAQFSGALPPKIGKDMIVLRKMVIFHTKYPKNVRACLSSAQFFKVCPS
jgi:hypothetical protein